MVKGLSPPIKAIFLLAYFALIFILTVLSEGSDVDMDLSNPVATSSFKIVQSVSVIILFIMPALLFVLFTSDKKLYYLKLTGFNPLLAPIVLILVFAVMPVINWSGEINSHLSLPDFMSAIENWMKASEERAKELTDAFMKMDGAGDLLVNIIVVALLAAVGEELLFRGAMQNVFLEWTKNSHVAVWITAILFSALHAQFYGFLPRMLLGVVLGYLYIWSGSLWLPILFHFLNNGLAVLVAYLISKNIITPDIETVGTGEGMWVYVLASAVISIYLMMFVYKHRKVEVTE